MSCFIRWRGPRPTGGSGGSAAGGAAPHRRHYYLWFIFTASYAGRALGDDPDKRVVGLVFTGIMIAALALRLWPRRGSALAEPKG